FSKDEVGKFPTVFRTYPFQRHKAAKVYTVREEGGNHYLSAVAAGEAQDIAVQVFDRFDWDLAHFPKISWRWRANGLSLPPPGTPGHFDDNACGVYIAFGGWGGKALKYIWSSDLPEGKVIEDTPGRFYVTVKASGPKNLGQWQTVTLNVVDEYRLHFKSEPF